MKILPILSKICYLLITSCLLKMYQAFSRFSVLQETGSWAWPEKKANVIPYNAHCSTPVFETNHQILFTGHVVVSSIQFQLTSESNATTPTFTLTCTSTGGRATTVSWTVNNSAVTEDSAHNITSQITNTTTATYNHTLMVTGRLVGEYQCNVSNNRPSSSSGMLAVVGKNCNYTHITGKLGRH